MVGKIQMPNNYMMKIFQRYRSTINNYSPKDTASVGTISDGNLETEYLFTPVVPPMNSSRKLVTILVFARKSKATRVVIENPSSTQIKGPFIPYNHIQFVSIALILLEKTACNTLNGTPIKEALAKAIAVEKHYSPWIQNRANLEEFLPTKQSNLPIRTMTDSFASALIPLSVNTDLQNKYTTFLGNVRIGRLLEDMDIFSVYVAQKHILNPKQPLDKPSPYTLVTALVDKMDFTDYTPKANEDIRLSGHVSWVGSSSMEVMVWLEQLSHGVWQNITRGIFLIAARDTSGKKAAFVNSLVASTDEEDEILAHGIHRKQKRKLHQSIHVTKVIPNDEEQQIIHNLFLHTVDCDGISLEQRNLPEDCIWMENCSLSNLIFLHPENRNIHYKVFGGYLMRQALELSWGLGYLFSKYRPVIKSISNITFNRPVEVSSLLRMNATVVYTYKQYIQITVYAESWDSSTGQNSTTNSFHFTYEVPQLVKEIFPCTYHEAMMYIDGRRHFNKIMLD